MTTDLQELAAEARAYFVQDKRNDGTEYWKTTDARPDWLEALIFTAHGDMMPDDHRYRFIVEALDALEELEDPDDIRLEVDIFTTELTGWLHSRVDRFAYCDDAMGDYGKPDGTQTLLQWGQYEEKREVLDSVRASLEAELEARAEAE